MAKTRSRAMPGREMDIGPLLEQVAKRLAGSRKLKRGIIVVRTAGVGGGAFCLDCSESGVRLERGATTLSSPPAIEILGDARQMHAVLGQKKDARKLFLAGAFRVRGDLRYFSDLAVELGVLKTPL